jgi:hypothetical protein
MLSACSSCSGFLPPSSTRCPHCGKEASARALTDLPLVRGLFAAATGGVTALTLMACYGIAPCTGNECTSGTGGTGTTGTGGAGGGTTTTTTTTGTGGAGGGTACLSCADASTKLGTVASMLCTGEADAFTALVTCACTSKCATECGQNTCTGKDITAECQTCIDTSCNAEETGCKGI